MLEKLNFPFSVLKKLKLCSKNIISGIGSATLGLASKVVAKTELNNKVLPNQILFIDRLGNYLDFAVAKWIIQRSPL
ncbi:MAG: hypothetical protein RMZ69_23625 [Nostoc sp. ChiQUE01a]|uniref:hypothetical protein n=1 Tax=Nostoc sp. CCY 9925 TaxID=3103865 RepID=UPI002AD6A1FE|nr:hypothetical protein [Nostoc sp. ChiQUE01a]